MPDVWADLSFRIEVKQRLRAFGDELRRSLSVETPVQTQHRVVLDQHVIGGHRLDASRGEPDHDDATFERDAFGRSLEHVTADRIVDDVGAPALGGLLDHVDKVLGVVVDREVGAHMATHLELGVRSCCRDDTRAGGLRELDRRRPNTARTAVHEEHLTGLEVSAAVKPKPTGLVVDEECGGLGERHHVRDLHDVLRLGVRDLGVGAAVQAFLRDDGEHAISGLEPASGWRRLHLAGHFRARHEREVRLDLVGPADLEQVEEVHSGCMDTDPDASVGCG